MTVSQGTVTTVWRMISKSSFARKQGINVPEQASNPLESVSHATYVLHGLASQVFPPPVEVNR